MFGTAIARTKPGTFRISEPNQQMNLTGPALWFFETWRHCSRPGKLSWSLSGKTHRVVR